MHSRREVVAVGGSLLAAALAGCGALVDDGLDISIDSDYRAWLPDAETGRREVIVSNPADIIDIDGDQEGTIFGTSTGDVAHLVRSVDGGSAAVVVAIGAFEVSDAREGFEQQEGVETDDDGEYGGYDVFSVVGEEGFSTFAAREEVAIAATDRGLFESVADAEDGSGPRLVDELTAFETAVDELGTPDWLNFDITPGGEPALNGDRIVRGEGFEFAEDVSSFTEVSVYATEDAARDDESQALERWDEYEEGTSGVETTVDGRTLLVSGDQETDRVRFLGG